MTGTGPTRTAAHLRGCHVQALVSVVFILATMIGSVGVWRRPTFIDSPHSVQWLDFYPFYSATTGYRRACGWALGTTFRGHTVNDFAQINQCGPLLRVAYLVFGGLGTRTGRFNDFRNIVRCSMHGVGCQRT
jgi:hypothetical protein